MLQGYRRWFLCITGCSANALQLQNDAIHYLLLSWQATPVNRLLPVCAVHLISAMITSDNLHKKYNCASNDRQAVPLHPPSPSLSSQLSNSSFQSAHSKGECPSTHQLNQRICSCFKMRASRGLKPFLASAGSPNSSNTRTAISAMCACCSPSASHTSKPAGWWCKSGSCQLPRLKKQSQPMP